MEFGKRLIQIRKQKKLSQDQLAKMVGIHGNILGRYEREEAKPSIEVATKLADALEVSLDYLVGKADLDLDKSVADKILLIQKLPEADREHILFALEAMLRDAKARAAYS